MNITADMVAFPTAVICVVLMATFTIYILIDLKNYRKKMRMNTQIELTKLWDSQLSIWIQTDMYIVDLLDEILIDNITYSPDERRRAAHAREIIMSGKQPKVNFN